MVRIVNISLYFRDLSFHMELIFSLFHCFIFSKCLFISPWGRKVAVSSQSKAFQNVKFQAVKSSESGESFRTLNFQFFFNKAKYVKCQISKIYPYNYAHAMPFGIISTMSYFDHKFFRPWVISTISYFDHKLFRPWVVSTIKVRTIGRYIHGRRSSSK